MADFNNEKINVIITYQKVGDRYVPVYVPANATKNMSFTEIAMNTFYDVTENSLETNGITKLGNLLAD